MTTLGSTSVEADISSAAGPTRIVTLVNEKIIIQQRLTASAQQLILSTSSRPLVNGVSTVSSDVIWDDTSGRFYYAIVGIGSTVSYLGFGWSKTASPNAIGDWCTYSRTYSGELPLSVVLGDTRNRLLMGYNRFLRSTGAFQAADLESVAKPSNGATTCGTPVSVVNRDVRSPSGDKLFGLVPANQVDPDNTGYAVSRPLTLPAQGVVVTRIAEAGPPSAGTVTLSNSLVPTGSYNLPPPAGQAGAIQRLSTGGAQFTQAVLARVPRNGNAFSLFTQHTIASGVTATQLRAYEIDPVNATLRRRFDIPNALNGAITSDRRLRNGSADGGNNVVIISNVAASTILPRVRAGSSINGGPFFSAEIQGAVSPVFCSGTVCPWGGASATPDPLSLKVYASSILPNSFFGRQWAARLYWVTP